MQFVYLLACHFLSLTAQPDLMLKATSLATFILYTGPEAVLPIASGLAAVIGLLLMLWQRVVHFFSQLLLTFRQRLARKYKQQN